MEDKHSDPGDTATDANVKTPKALRGLENYFYTDIPTTQSYGYDRSALSYLCNLSDASVQ